MAPQTRAEITDWLIDGARDAIAPEKFFAQLCEKITETGIPLWRVGVFVRTLHPNIMGRSFVWRPDAGVETSSAPHDIVETDTYLTSPIAEIYRTGEPVRRHIDKGEGLERSTFLRELRDEGVTDYMAFPMLFTDGSMHSVTWSTKAPGGFTDEQVASLTALIPALTRVSEIRNLRRTAATLLDTYVGSRAGERILAGAIRRGSGDAINAIIWLSDMRGFTALSDRVSSQKVVNLLNRYFDCQVPPITKYGGEVLKFMGDGLLAIFPVADSEFDQIGVFQDALKAAREARANVEDLNKARGPWSTDRVRFGVALHVGQVLYGNIGGGNRLDFTCIGPAVNLAARIEKITGKVGRTILASADFAQYQQSEWEPVGEYSMAGFASKHRVLGLRDETPYLTNVSA
jgi:adenylate cyclase